MNKKTFAAVFAGIAILGLVAVISAMPSARAESENGKTHKLETMEKKLVRFEDRLDEAWKNNENEGERAVTLKANGDFRVSGAVVNSVDANAQTLNVRFFGFDRTVSVAGAKLVGGGKSITLADFQAGDKLAGSGNFNETSRSITVKEIHNLSYRDRNRSNIENRIKELLEMIRQLQEQIKNNR